MLARKRPVDLLSLKKNVKPLSMTSEVVSDVNITSTTGMRYTGTKKRQPITL